MADADERGVCCQAVQGSGFSGSGFTVLVQGSPFVEFTRHLNQRRCQPARFPQPGILPHPPTSRPPGRVRREARLACRAISSPVPCQIPTRPRPRGSRFSGCDAAGMSGAACAPSAISLNRLRSSTLARLSVPIATRTPTSIEPADWRHAGASPSVAAGAGHNCGTARRQLLQLVIIELHTVNGDQAIVEDPEALHVFDANHMRARPIPDSRRQSVRAGPATDHVPSRRNRISSGDSPR